MKLFHANFGSSSTVQLTKDSLQGGRSQQMFRCDALAMNVKTWSWVKGKEKHSLARWHKGVIYLTLIQYILMKNMQHCLSSSVCPISIRNEDTERFVNIEGTKLSLKRLMSCRNLFAEAKHQFLN